MVDELQLGLRSPLIRLFIGGVENLRGSTPLFSTRVLPTLW